MLSQVNLDGYSLTLMDCTIDHLVDTSKAILMEDKYIIAKECAETTMYNYQRLGPTNQMA